MISGYAGIGATLRIHAQRQSNVCEGRRGFSHGAAAQVRHFDLARVRGHTHRGEEKHAVRHEQRDREKKQASGGPHMLTNRTDIEPCKAIGPIGSAGRTRGWPDGLPAVVARNLRRVGSHSGAKSVLRGSSAYQPCGEIRVEAITKWHRG